MADARRSSARYVVSLEATLAVDESTQLCTIVNLSLGGALLSACTKLPMGHRVRLTFLVPTISERIDIVATVRWSDDKATGIQFDGLRARDVWALGRFFERLAAPAG